MFYAGIALGGQKLCNYPVNANFYIDCCGIIFQLVRKNTHTRISVMFTFRNHFHSYFFLFFSLLVRGIKLPLLLFMFFINFWPL